MLDRIIVLIAISGIISLVSTMHGHAYANLIMGKSEINSNQIQHFYPTSSLINNQTTNKEIMSELKSQIEYTDPFKIRGIDNHRNSINQSSTEGINPNDLNSNDLNSNELKHIDKNDCKSNCPEKSKPTKYEIPFELPSIPFP